MEPAALPTRFYVPLLQQTGGEARALVEPGQAVRKGDRIGRFEHRGGGHVHAPTSGVVTAITSHAISHPSGMEGRCVVIRNNFV